MKNFIYAILFSSLVISCGRSSDDKNTSSADALPAATQTGANTAGCIINSKVLIPKNGDQSIGGSPLYGLNLNAGNNFTPNLDDYWQLEIANKQPGDGAGVILYIKNMKTGIGDYIVDQSNGDLYANGPDNNQIIASIRKNGINKTYYSSSNSGKISLTRISYNSGSSIFSGTFSAILYNKDNPSETIQITDGRFDINYATLNH